MANIIRRRLGQRQEIWILLPVSLLVLVALSTFALFSYRNAVELLIEERRSEAVHLAHRLASELTLGPVPDAEELGRRLPTARAVAVIDDRGRQVTTFGTRAVAAPTAFPLVARRGAPGARRGPGLGHRALPQRPPVLFRPGRSAGPHPAQPGARPAGPDSGAAGDQRRHHPVGAGLPAPLPGTFRGPGAAGAGRRPGPRGRGRDGLSGRDLRTRPGRFGRPRAGGDRRAQGAGEDTRQEPRERRPLVRRRGGRPGAQRRRRGASRRPAAGGGPPPGDRFSSSIRSWWRFSTARSAAGAR